MLETSSLLTGAAPFLLGIGPAGLPIGETSIAILMDVMARNKAQWWLILGCPWKLVTS